MKTFLKFLLIFSVLAVIIVFGISNAISKSGSAEQNVLEEQTFDEEIKTMEVQVKNARVDILPSNDETTRIVLTGNSDDYSLAADHSGEHLQIEVDNRFRLFNFNFNRSYSLQVYVPASGFEALRVNSNNGAISAEDIGAVELSIEADNGRIELESVKGERINIKTDNGRIELTNMDADINASSSNGRINFTDVSGKLEAKTNNGRIELTTETLDFPVDFETDNGRIEIRTENEPANIRIEADADNGSIELFGQNSEQLSFGTGDTLIRLASDNGRISVE